jgi:hypothetical protein
MIIHYCLVQNEQHMSFLQTREHLLVDKTQNKVLEGFGEAELECEDAIMNDKQRFGRVRTSLMKHLRAKHGNMVANRALSRINKRVSEGSLNIKRQLTPIEENF